MKMGLLCLPCLAGLMVGINALPGRDAPRQGGAEADAIQKQGEAFVEAFHKGDAKAVAALWTVDGDYTDSAGQLCKGREAIEKTFAALFAEHKGLRVRIESISLRFVTPEVAIEDGTSAVHGAGGPPSKARFTNLLVKKDGKWLLSSVRESPLEPSNHYHHLRGLEWAIGDWAGETPSGATERLAMTWSDNQNFIIATLSTTVKNIPVGSATLRIGWDPVAKHLRSWVFDSTGGFGEGSWTTDGKKWLVKTASVLHDGKKMAATYVLAPVDVDTMTLQAMDRSEDGTKLPDTAEIKLKRVK